MKKRFLGGLTAFALAFGFIAGFFNSPAVHATFPGTNGKILFMSGSNYYTIDANGQGKTVQSHPADYFGDPKYSPDGQRILYQGVNQSTMLANIWSMDEDGTNRQQLVAAPSSYPQWLPDGTSFTYTEQQPTQPSFGQLALSRLGGRAKQVLMYYTNGPLSPDGNRLITTTDWFPSITMYNNVQLPVGHPDKSSDSLYYEDTSGHNVGCSTWSPDGQKVAFVRSDYFTGEDNEIYVLDVATKNVDRTITPASLSAFSFSTCPVWSPDGNFLAYSVYPTESDWWDGVNSTMYKLSLTSGVSTQLATNVQSILDWQPIKSWAPPEVTDIHRFYSPLTKHHFFTANTAEADYIRSHFPPSIWTYENVGFGIRTTSGCSANGSVYRFYSETLKTHLYTMDENEKTHIIANFPPSVWRYEGVAYCADRFSSRDTKPVYRFYSELLKTHLFTINELEAIHIMDNYPEDIWRYEGVAYYAYPN